MLTYENSLEERKYKENKERLRFAIELAEMGTWEFDVKTGELFWDKRCKELYSMKPDMEVTFEVCQQCIYPDDVEDFRATIERGMNGENDGEYEMEFRSVGYEDQKIRWLKARGKVFFNELNEPYYIIGTTIDITPQKQASEALYDLMKKKDEFMSIASHELRTPVTSIKASLQLIDRLTQKTDDAVLRSFVEKANRQMNRLNDILRDLLDVTKIQQNHLTINKIRFNVQESIKACLEGIITDSTRHKLIIGGDTDISMYADKQKIEQVINNLVTNAIKYSPKAEKVVIHIEKLHSSIKISVIDYGIGIAKDKLLLVFDRYFRVETTSKNFQGIGLGLYISAEIVKLHGGEIGVESKEGKGSVFWFTLPD